MDDALAHFIKLAEESNLQVLILVVMDDALALLRGTRCYIFAIWS